MEEDEHKKTANVLCLHLSNYITTNKRRFDWFRKDARTGRRHELQHSL